MASRMPSGRFGAVWQVDSGVGHQMADIADEQQARPGRVKGLPSGESHSRSGSSVRVRWRPPLSKVAVEVAAHHAEPVAVGRDLVVGVDRGDGVFEVDDGGEGGFEDDVGEACRVGSCRRVIAVDDQFDVQAVVAEDQRRWRCGFAAIACEGGWVCQRRDCGAVLYAPALNVGVPAAGEGDGFVEEGFGAGDDLGAARCVVAAGSWLCREGRRCRRARRRGCPSGHWRR